MNQDPAPSLNAWEPAARELWMQSRQRVYRDTDKMFAWLMIAQWLVGIGLAYWISPLTWKGSASETHPHVWAAILLGGAIASVPVSLALWLPGAILTRHVVAAAQVLMSALLIHLTAGRIETHFHVFGSLAFLSFYRDWRVLITASAITAVDHVLRGLLWPQSVYGILDAGLVRAAEHAGWVVFEDVFLVFSCVRGQAEMREIARQRSQLNAAHSDIECQVRDRTGELEEQTRRLGEIEAETRCKSKVLECLSEMQSGFISGDDPKRLFAKVLAHALALTESNYGFVGEVLHTPEGAPYLKTLGISVVALDDEARELYDKYSALGFEFHNLDTLLGAVITSRQAVLANAPHSDSRRGGLPPGHTPLNAFLGLPLLRDGEIVGMIGVANRPGGYRESDVETVQPFLTTVAQLIAALRNEKRRVEAEERLRGTMAELVGQRALVEKAAVVLEARNRDLEEARERADASNRAKTEFLANMSHEIRTPMTAILGYADLLLVDGDITRAPERRIDAIQTIQRNGAHLLGIINDILDLSKIEAGKLTVESVRCSPRAIVEEVLSLMRVRSQAKGIALDAAYESHLPAGIHTDPTRLRQILVNLVGNAIKFTEVGHVRLMVRLVAGDAPTLEFDVVDTGIGMTSEQRERLFQPFTQADTSTTRQYGGTGLGLTIGKRLARLLGGDVCIVDSAPGVGTRFRLTIAAGPLEGAENIVPGCTDSTRDATTVVPKPETPPCSLPGCRVLLAEDGLDNQRLVAFVLKKAGAEVTVVENGQLAVDAALQAVENEQPFHVILMDMQMPVLDGYGAVALLRAKDYRGPVIALTAHAMGGDRAKCLAAGCDDYATKPIDRTKLIQQIASHLGAARQSVTTA